MSEFFNQGGYALFVWSAYGMGALMITAEVLLLIKRQRTILSRIGRLIRMRAEGEHS